MAMVTRCPACATLFRVTPPQLQARAGRVRCGRCMKVFDGFETLATLPAESGTPSTASNRAPTAEEAARSAPASAPAPSVARAEPATPPATVEQAPAGQPLEAAVLLTEARGERPVQAIPSLASRPPAGPGATARAVSSSVHSAARTDSALTSSPPVSADALFLQQAHAKRRGRSWLWAAGTVILMLALGLQAVYFYRGELAAHYRSLKPAITQACKLIDCAVPLPQRPTLINIEASDLQSVDPARPGVIELTATLRNHAGFDVAYPALDLVLTNTKEHTLARRIFLPHEYLDGTRDVASGFPANAEITVRLGLDTGDLGAAGFRLGLLAASAR